MKYIYTLVSLLFLISCEAQSDADKRRQSVENSLTPDIVYGDSLLHLNIEEQMKKYNIKGVSVAVIKDYKLDWAKGYGLADVEEKRSVTVNTRFQAASISKSLNSLGLLKLVQQMKIDVDADINNYLRTWKFPYDSISKGKKISLRNLLTHTAGLTVHGFRGYEYGDSIPSIVEVLNGKRPANSPAVRSQFAPSTRFQYSGGGTTVSQVMVTDITGMRYEEYMKKNVLDPLGMTNSFFNQPPPAGTKELATGYYGNNQPVKGKYHIYPEQAAAALWTTPGDLAKYIIETQLAYEGRSSKVLNKDITRMRLTPYIDSSAALGSFIINKGGIKWFTHNGGNEAFLCTSYGSLEKGNGVVVMINGDNYSIIPEITNSVALVYGWKDFYKPTFKKIVTVPKDTLQAYSGKYLLIKDTLSITFCDDDLCVRQNNQPPNGLKLVFSSSTVASLREVPNVNVTFLRNAEGKIDELEISEPGGKTRCKRLQ